MKEITKRTAEEITRDIVEYFKNNEEIYKDCMEELDGYNGYLGDSRYYIRKAHAHIPKRVSAACY